MRKPLLLLAAGAVGIAVFSWLFETGRLLADTDVAVTSAAVAAGSRIYARNCAACHGPGVDDPPRWRPVMAGIAPPPPTADGPLPGSTDSYLVHMVREGSTSVHDDRFRDGMPAFRDVLNNREIHAVIAFLKDRWPDHLPAIRGGNRSNGGG